MSRHSTDFWINCKILAKNHAKNIRAHFYHLGGAIYKQKQNNAHISKYPFCLIIKYRLSIFSFLHFFFAVTFYHHLHFFVKYLWFYPNFFFLIVDSQFLRYVFLRRKKKVGIKSWMIHSHRGQSPLAKTPQKPPKKQEKRI